jgi:hypothetical protein
MKKVISYQILVIMILAFLWAQGPLGWMPSWLVDYQLAINCILIASLAGVLYCIRAVYTNYSARNTWEKRWEVWYYLRPLASAVAGLVAFIFLKAGIAVLEASQTGDAGMYGYMAFSFVAGYNVDRFLKMIEDLAKSKFGVEQSGAYRKGDDDNS